MSTSAQVHVDDRAFKAALGQYMGFTSKTAVEALNGKMRDVMFLACKHTVLGETKSTIRGKVRDMRALAVWRQCRHHGIGFPPKKPAPFNTPDVINSMAKIGDGRGFMKSAFAKAGYLFKATAASKVSPPANAYMKHKGTKVEYQFATLSILSAASKTIWNVKKFAGDKATKQSMAENAIAKAKDLVYYDMVGYLNRKLAQKAKAISGS